jgi:hypothetical protein
MSSATATWGETYEEDGGTFRVGKLGPILVAEMGDVSKVFLGRDTRCGACREGAVHSTEYHKREVGVVMAGMPSEESQVVMGDE